MAGHSSIDLLEQKDSQAFEWAARALYEASNGEGAWTRANSSARSGARQALRSALGRLAKHGWTIQAVGERPQNRPESSGAISVAGRLAARRPTPSGGR